MCGMDTGLVWIISSVESYTAVFVLEYVTVDSDYLLATSMISLDLSWICEVGIVAFEGSLMTLGGCLFCLPSLCVRLIMLAVVDK